MPGDGALPAEVTGCERGLLDVLRSRRGWLAIKLYEVGPGIYDIALRLDGTYAGADVPEEIAQDFRHELGCFGRGIVVVDSGVGDNSGRPSAWALRTVGLEGARESSGQADETALPMNAATVLGDQEPNRAPCPLVASTRTLRTPVSASASWRKGMRRLPVTPLFDDSF
jgi:hypothetical protein